MFHRSKLPKFSYLNLPEYSITRNYQNSRTMHIIPHPRGQISWSTNLPFCDISDKIVGHNAQEWPGCGHAARAEIIIIIVIFSPLGDQRGKEREIEREREHNNASRNIQPDVTASVASLSPRVKLQGCHRSVSSCPSEAEFSLNDCEASSSIRRKSMENGGFNPWWIACMSLLLLDRRWLIRTGPDYND